MLSICTEISSPDAGGTLQFSRKPLGIGMSFGTGAVPKVGPETSTQPLILTSSSREPCDICKLLSRDCNLAMDIVGNFQPGIQHRI